MTKPIIERRFAPPGVEIRTDDDGTVTFEGHAAVFNKVADLGWFREKVSPGAFRKTIKEADVRFLYNHDPDSVMARTTAGTLKLSEDKRGLKTKATLDPDDVDVQRVVPKLRSGNVSQMSFGFRVIKDEWDEEPDDGGTVMRTLKEVELFDVSAVTYPAYAETDAAVRSATSSAKEIADEHGIDVEDVEPDEAAKRYAEQVFDRESVAVAPDGRAVTVPVTITFPNAQRSEPSLDHALRVIAEADGSVEDKDAVRKAQAALERMLTKPEDQEPDASTPADHSVASNKRKRELGLIAATH